MDIIYIILIIVGVLMFVGITTAGVSNVLYKKTLKEKLGNNSSIGKSATELTKKELSEKNISAQIVRIPGEDGAHYDYQNKVVALSDRLYSSYSPVAQAIALHEVGHAIQDNKNSKKFLLFKRINLVEKILSLLFWGSFILGIILLFAIDYEPLYAYLAFGLTAVCLLLTTIFKFTTYSMEKEASALGIQMLKENNISDDDMVIAKSIYSIALTSYFASIFQPVVNLFNGITWVIYNTIGRLFR